MISIGLIFRLEAWDRLKQMYFHPTKSSKFKGNLKVSGESAVRVRQVPGATKTRENTCQACSTCRVWITRHSEGDTKFVFRHFLKDLFGIALELDPYPRIEGHACVEEKVPFGFARRTGVPRHLLNTSQD